MPQLLNKIISLAFSVKGTGSFLFMANPVMNKTKEFSFSSRLAHLGRPYFTVAQKGYSFDSFGTANKSREPILFFGRFLTPPIVLPLGPAIQELVSCNTHISFHYHISCYQIKHLLLMNEVMTTVIFWKYTLLTRKIVALGSKNPQCIN